MQYGSSLVTFYKKNVGFCVDRLLVVDYWQFLKGEFGSCKESLWPLPLWRGGRCREVKKRVNVSNVYQDQKKWLL